MRGRGKKKLDLGLINRDRALLEYPREKTRNENGEVSESNVVFFLPFNRYFRGKPSSKSTRDASILERTNTRVFLGGGITRESDYETATFVESRIRSRDRLARTERRLEKRGYFAGG